MDSKLRGHFILRKRELFIPNVAEWLALVLHTQEVPASSVGLEAGYPD
jgi:hypothetical protein